MKRFTLISFMVLMSVCAGIPVAPKNFVNLGQINGKFFFFDRSSGMNATSAALHCETGGLQLAEIVTLDELEFLNSNTNEDFHGTGYWTAGEDALDFRQFVWANSRASISQNLTLYIMRPSQTCLYYLSGTDKGLSSIPCIANFYVLCQT